MVVEITDLPDEILELILSYLPPYKDLEQCQLVNKRWFAVVKNLMRRITINFQKGLCDFCLCWKSNNISCVNVNNGNNNISGAVPQIAGRFSHSAVIHENSMYVFGGGSSTNTTFNDLWRFDLSKREWVRPLSMGSYPSPKGSATMVSYKDFLILFGGWRYTSLHPPWWLFDELHIYDIKRNRWMESVRADNKRGPPPMAGHSATIHKNNMVVFGGYKISNQINSSSNDVWVLNLDVLQWSQPNIGLPKPPARYGQFQIMLSDSHLLIMGGCGGPNNMFNDAWILDMTNDDKWYWKNLPIKNKKWAASHLWCNPGCSVGSKLVVLGPIPNLPNDFQILKQRHLPDRANQNFNLRQLAVDFERELHGLNHQEERLNVNNIDNRRNNNDNNNRMRHENDVNNENDEARAGCSYNRQPNREQLQEQPNCQNNGIDDEAASRLQRNLALRRRLDDARLPKRFDEPFEDRLRMAAFNVHGNSRRIISREKQLERLHRFVERRNVFRRFVSGNARRPNPQEQFRDDDNQQQIQPIQIQVDNQFQQQTSRKKTRRNSLALFLCDLSNALSPEPYLEWIEYKNYGILSGAPERLILSSIVPGNGELIMFGGVHKETLYESTHEVSNSLHFLTIPKKIM